ncbi:MAG: glycan-binding surface protein [Tannerella sp.]|jgi:hypothetical protein|nr:glycan-binding surface protein [Tannerella sp.]
MKTIKKSILFVAITMLATMFNWSCEDSNDDAEVPFISYVRITNPASADSLLVAANQGQWIAIIGGNLQTTREIWFNDQRASLTPAYITSATILVGMPSEIPAVVTNKIKLIFADGDSLLYDFRLTINKPVISSMDCEYTLDGEMATIHGDYFYLPVAVTFPGNLTVSTEDGADIMTVNEANNLITVRVPEGAQPGQIIISTNFGAQISDFWFRDNRNMIEGFDSSDPGTAGTLVTDPGPDDPPIINGKYTRIIKPAMGSWDWTQVYVRWSAPYYAIPDEAILHPDQYYYKFEVCTTKPFNANGVRGWVTDPSVQSSTPEPMFYIWKPPFDTKGAWQTVTIPLTDFSNALGSFFPKVLPTGEYFSAFVFCEPGELNCDMSFDNFRIVPKTIPKPPGSDY